MSLHSLATTIRSNEESEKGRRKVTFRATWNWWKSPIFSVSCLLASVARCCFIMIFLLTLVFLLMEKLNFFF